MLCNRIVKIIASILLVISILDCDAQKAKPSTLNLSDFKFDGIFGYSLKDSLSAYCLLGTGFFRAPHSENSDSLIAAWITNHPKARVVTVTVDYNKPEKRPMGASYYCWLIDGKDTINNYLVRNGCYPGGTMMRPQTYEELSKAMKDITKKSEWDFKVVIETKAYNTFITQIRAAKIYAKEQKLGIWAKKNTEEED